MKNSKAFSLFIDELKERLSQLDELEQKKLSSDNEFLDNIKNGFHKTKGAAGMFGFSDLADISAELENFFGAKLRNILSKNLESKALIEQFKISVEKIINGS